MRFKGTAALFVVFLGLGVYVYFTEYRGREERQKQEAAKKKLFQFEQKDVAEISLVYPDRTITGVKKGEKQWEITSPAGVEADPDEWEQLASSITSIEREDTVAENAQDLAPFGLKDPPVKVLAKLNDGKQFEIMFGGENPKKTFAYAKLGSANDVFLTGSSSVRTFTKTVSDLRNKKVLDFETDDVDSVKITEGARELELQKSGENWQVKKPVDTKADSGDIATFISSIRFARVSSFPDTPIDAKTAGLDPPAMRITLHDGKAKADRALLIGKTAQTDKYYARDASRDAVFIIDKDIAEKARRPVFDWRDKTVAKLDRDKVDKIEIQRGAENVSAVKDGADWKAADGKKLQWDKISSMLNAVEFEKAKDIIDAPKSLSTYGLDKPKQEVVFRQGSNEIGRVSFGADSKMPEGIYVKTAESPAVMVVSKDIFDKFNVKAEDLVESTPAPAEGAAPAPDAKK